MTNVEINGNLCKDPVFKITQSGAKLCYFKVASNYYVRKKDGVYEKRADFFPVTCWGSIAEAARYLTKGSAVWIKGRGQTRLWTDPDGLSHKLFQINAMEMLVPIRSLFKDVVQMNKAEESGEGPAADSPVFDDSLVEMPKDAVWDDSLADESPDWSKV